MPAASVELAASVGRLAALVDTCRESAEDAGIDDGSWDKCSRALAARRIELWTADRRALATAGEGAAVGGSRRALSRRAPPSVRSSVAGGQEMAVPIRWDGGVVATLAARWDRAPAEAAAWLTAAAAILAARVQARCASGEDEARCATLTPGLLGRSAAMAAVRHAVARAGPAPFAVLIQGESGVGKELVARAVHAMSARHAQRMCDVNCAALPDDLLESELFGHVRGAFTGALGDRAGLFEDAHGGTLFLDEVVDLSARAQAKLLRVLQQQEVRRLGESRTRRIDVRIVSAANRDPREAVAAARSAPIWSTVSTSSASARAAPARAARGRGRRWRDHFWRAAAERVGSRAALGREAVDALTSIRLAGQRPRAAERDGGDGGVRAPRWTHRRAASAAAVVATAAARGSAASPRRPAPRVRTARGAGGAGPRRRVIAAARRASWGSRGRGC